MHSRRFDVLVVGGGPGGSTAARLLARRGYRVGLFEKAHMPRYKACGGGLCLRHPERLHLDLTPVVLGWVEKFTVTHEGRRRRSIDLSVPQGEFALIDRVRFDSYLWEQAVEAGAEMYADTAVRQVELEPDGVRLSTPHGQYAGRFLVGADGADSLVNGPLEIQGQSHRTLSLVIETKQDLDLPIAPSEVVVSFGCVPRGYAWIFHKGPTLSLGVFTARPGSRDLRPWLKQYLDRWGLEVGRLPAAIHGAWQRLGSERGPWHKGRVALVGDAAALSDPFTGEGISHALDSAVLAAGAIEDSLRDGCDNLSAYSQRIEEEIAFDFPHAWRLSRKFYRFPRLSFFYMARNRELCQRFLDTISGRLTYGEFNRLARKRLFLRMLGSG